MSKDDDKILAGILGGLAGMIIAAPKIEDKQDLEAYRKLKAEIFARQQKVGDLSNIAKLLGNSYYNAFIESFRMYLYGFFKGAVVQLSAVIECLLKDKYGKKDFYDLIEEAKQKGLINQTEYHLLHAVRSERNPSAHDILKEVTEDDAVLIIRITNKIMYKFI